MTAIRGVKALRKHDHRRAGFGGFKNFGTGMGKVGSFVGTFR